MPVDIHGKNYTLVAERINQINDDAKTYSLTSQILKWDDQFIIIQATLLIEGEGTYTGTAMERLGSNHINKTSHVECCETSAWGRALAAAGYGGDSIASADELVMALNQEKQAPTQTPKHTNSEPRNAYQATDALPVYQDCETEGCKKRARLPFKVCYDCNQAKKQGNQNFISSVTKIVSKEPSLIEYVVPSQNPQVGDELDYRVGDDEWRG